MLFQKWCWAFLFWGLAVSSLQGSRAEIMPLDEIEPGMLGEWKTVVSGSEVETFQLKIIGIAENFVGPKKSVIIAEGLDDSQILSGPVSGMSGSPVYIDGKLIGAYAYGFPWSKEQAIIGITPIEDMLEILEEDVEISEKKAQSSKKGLPFSRASKRGVDFRNEAGDAVEQWHWKRVLSGAEESDYIQSALKPVPTPLFVSGISAKALAVFEPEIKARGLNIAQAPMGKSQNLGDVELVPGSAVAGLLLDGDFGMAGVGTVTWVDGDTVLAFGHSMSNVGKIAMPMAPAEVITVINNLESSFKLSNVGERMGVIYQDKLTGIAGKIGGVAPTTPLKYKVTYPGKKERVYSGNAFVDKSMTPLVAAIGLIESLISTMDHSLEQTFYVSMEMRLRDFEPIQTTNVVTGAGGAVGIARDFFGLYDMLLNNPFAMADIESVSFEIDVVNEWRGSSLRNVQLLSGQARQGETLRLSVNIDNYQGIPTREVLEIPIPAGTAGEELEILIADAPTADNYDKGIFLNTIESLDGLVDFLRQSRSSQKLYVKLLRRTKGLSLKNENMYDLPPSVRKLIQSKRSDEIYNTIGRKTIWEGDWEFPGAISGSLRVPVSVDH